MVETSIDSITASVSTLQNCAILFLSSEFIECSVRQTKMSGCIPASNKVLPEKSFGTSQNFRLKCAYTVKLIIECG